ncbi:MAG: hypothetical protein BWY31_02378 [Lentisphaerae bacterium ADurb.Bin242]|nr:MAG: hypothetical protein BWY31_02378 [Lentisphaerae bacterium ADurb.Bin242]
MSFFRNQYVSLSLRMLVACLLLWWVIRGMNFGQMSHLTVGGLVFSFGAAFLCISVQVLLTAWRWRMLLEGQNIALSFYRCLSLTFQGMMFSLFMPGGAVGGDLLKAAFLTRETEKGRKLEGVTTIFIDRVVGMLGLFSLVLIIAAFCFPAILRFTPSIRMLVLILLLACAAGVAAGLVLFFQDIIFRFKPLAFCLRKADGFAKGRISRILASVEICRKEGWILFRTFLMSLLVIHPLLLAGVFFIMAGISGRFPDPLAAFLAASLGNAASAVPVTPGGLGTRDKVTEVVLNAFGFDPGISSLTPILYSTATICAALVGVFFFLADSLLRKKNPPNPEKQ